MEPVPSFSRPFALRLNPAPTPASPPSLSTITLCDFLRALEQFEGGVILPLVAGFELGDRFSLCTLSWLIYIYGVLPSMGSALSSMRSGS